MRKLSMLIALLLSLQLLCGCFGGGAGVTTQATIPSTQASTTAPTTEPTTEPTTAPTTEPPTEPTTAPTTAPTEPEPEVDAALLPMGSVYITAGTISLEEYGAATVRAEWTDGVTQEQTVQLRYRGNSTYNYTNKKSFNIKFDSKEPFLGMEEGKKWSLLANPFDKSLLRIMLGFDLAEWMGIQYASDTRFCKVYLNGVYQGVYVAIEPIDDKKNRVDIDVKDGDAIFERAAGRDEAGKIYFKTNSGMRWCFDQPDDLSEPAQQELIAQLNAVESALWSYNHENYEQLMDVSSFVDFYIYQEMIKDIDFGTFSTRIYLKDGILYAGPPWDMDLAMGNVSDVFAENKYKLYYNRAGMGNGSGDSTQGFWAVKDYYLWLTEDPYFMDLVRQRWQELRLYMENLATDNALGQNRIDQYLAAFQTDLEENYTLGGWSVSKPGVTMAYNHPAKDYIGNVEQLRTWLINRFLWLDEQLQLETPQA